MPSPKTSIVAQSPPTGTAVDLETLSYTLGKDAFTNKELTIGYDWQVEEGALAVREHRAHTKVRARGAILCLDWCTAANYSLFCDVGYHWLWGTVSHGHISLASLCPVSPPRAHTYIHMHTHTRTHTHHRRLQARSTSPRT